METRQVHQRVRCEEEVGGKDTDGVEVGQHDEPHGGHEDEDVAAERIIVGIVAFLEEVHSRVDIVLPDRLHMCGVKL